MSCPRMPEKGDHTIPALLDQPFCDDASQLEALEECRRLAQSYVQVDGSVAVLSDFASDVSYMYAGGFGKSLHIEKPFTLLPSAFEDCIFHLLHPDDLLERHILELRYFAMQKELPVTERTKFSCHCRVRVSNGDGGYTYINHRIFYLKSHQNGSIWLSLCLYAPATDNSNRAGIDGKIMNQDTGEIIAVEQYSRYDRSLLTGREVQILSLVAKGLGSKQIAAKLHIALYTVYRHRQNIISKMQVTNATEAVRIAMTMGLLHE
ncbi:response regulator transcription factor [Filimonas effusa]|uniref:LuxR family transcriptional regulator n=1 Tax=Filimonas effusa TaxID=2508721 RepID=A0A4Q1D696_9BACT|nr:helix-turn-helix transcriptional regulator [Filimonas effusa]RXK83221.1 LuxR family transcriptional regulator [Filimonas effusa]